MTDKNTQPAATNTTAHRGPLYSYVTGFVLSILLTVMAFGLVLNGPFLQTATIYMVLGILAFLQFVVQLVFFLHLSREMRPRWHLFIFALAVSVVLIVVVGSLWIMYHLNSRMMPTNEEMQIYMTNHEGM